MNIEEFKEKYNRKFGEINVERGYHTIPDESVSYFERQVEDDGTWDINLDHSCGEWTIGTIEEAKEFCKNLEQAIEYAETN